MGGFQQEIFPASFAPGCGSGRGLHGLRGCGVCGWTSDQAADSSNSWAPPAPAGGPVSCPSPLLASLAPLAQATAVLGECPEQLAMTRWEVTFWSSPLAL